LNFKKQNDRRFNEPHKINLNIVCRMARRCSKKEKSWFQNLSKEILPGSLTQLDPSGEWYTITVFLLLRSLFHFFTFSLFHFFWLSSLSYLSKRLKMYATFFHVKKTSIRKCREMDFFYEYDIGLDSIDWRLAKNVWFVRHFWLFLY
jgi:hypothetical protein